MRVLISLLLDLMWKWFCDQIYSESVEKLWKKALKLATLVKIGPNLTDFSLLTRSDFHGLEYTMRHILRWDSRRMNFNRGFPRRFNSGNFIISSLLHSESLIICRAEAVLSLISWKLSFDTVSKAKVIWIVSKCWFVWINSILCWM